MPDLNIYITHDSALYYWRTNPSHFVLEGYQQNLRKPRHCATSHTQLKTFNLPEIEFGPEPIHILLSPDMFKPRVPRYVCHIQKAALPPHSLFPLYGGVHVVSPELCLIQMFKTRPFLEAIIIGMEFCGTYAYRPDSIEEKAKRDYALVDALAFSRHVNASRGVGGLLQARKGAAFLVNGSASPMETMVYLLLCLPQKYGGYNLGKPELNPEMDVPREYLYVIRQQHIYPDLLWREQKVIVEYDGAWHNYGQQPIKDTLRKAIFESMGYTVYQLKKQHVYDPILFDGIARSIAKRLDKRVRPLTAKQQYAREELRALLPKRPDNLDGLDDPDDPDEMDACQPVYP